ncbi:MAG: polyprenyl synthetase family protein [Opitutales bacterium]|nr:polyprenyl synthetase family protein [Opitutales bacterium]
MQPSSIAPSNPPALAEGIGEIVRPLAAHFAALDDFLEDQVAAFEPEVQPLVRYTFQHSGKKIRPILVFFAGWSETEAQSPSADLVCGAAIVELVHLATLVHDDILDGAAVRHRMATAAEKYGSPSAVLLGDALFAHALRLAAGFPNVEVCRAVATATRQVCSGEIVQTLSKRELRVDFAHYYRVIDLKTAELFAVSAHLGAFLGRSSAEFDMAATTFARKLGIAYQIYDDLTDVVGQESKTGKTLGTDLAGGKPTLPLLLLLRALPGKSADELQARLLQGHTRPGDLEDLFRQHRIIEQVRDQFETILQEGEAALAAFADNPAVPRLLELSSFIRQAMRRQG